MLRPQKRNSVVSFNDTLLNFGLRGHRKHRVHRVHRVHKVTFLSTWNIYTADYNRGHREHRVIKYIESYGYLYSLQRSQKVRRVLWLFIQFTEVSVTENIEYIVHRVTFLSTWNVYTVYRGHKEHRAHIKNIEFYGYVYSLQRSHRA